MVKILKRLIKKLIKALKEFGEKDFGRFKGIHVIRVVVVILLVWIMGSFISSVSQVKSIDYPVVYKTNDKKLMLLNAKDGKGDEIKIGSEVKQIVSGIKQHYTAEEMVGKKVMVLVNLKPAKLAGVLSEGMLLCAEDAEGNLALMTPEKPMPSGAEIA